MQKQPNRWSCVLTAFANATDIDQNELIQLIGHDGSEIAFPDQPFPHDRRGFDPRELTYVLLKKNILVVELDALLVRVTYNGQEHVINKLNELLTEVIPNNDGVLIGIVNGVQHAIAWVNDKLLTEANITIANISVNHFFLIKDLNQETGESNNG